MQRIYYDATGHEKPDLFIRFTCNPKWAEIKEHLEYLVHRQINGVVIKFHCDIEFQKISQAFRTHTS